MDESYELVSKAFLKNLKDENKKLREELTKATPLKDTQQQNKEFVDQLLKSIHDKAQEERNLLLKHLSDIKDLNKSTLDNVLSRTETLDNRLEHVVDTLKGLVEGMKGVLEEISQNNSDEIKSIVEEIKVSMPKENTSQDEILTNLKSIELFMNNLRTLLSYVKPGDLTMNTPSQPQELTPPPINLK